ncbi:hypothetical protein, partial [Streptomyces ipomoeae]|uniref:hypothetical protein n=1 Tax=Streptomyces ipomoeae TaxID=103232 RepID=UPI0029BB22F8
GWTGPAGAPVGVTVQPSVRGGGTALGPGRTYPARRRWRRRPPGAGAERHRTAGAPGAERRR